MNRHVAEPEYDIVYIHTIHYWALTLEASVPNKTQNSNSQSENSNRKREMASAIVRSTLRTALRGGPRLNPASTRSFSAGASAEEEAREAAKWEKITYVGIAACTILAVVNLSKGHPHFEEPPAYPYLHIRNKEFPWGPDGLFEVKEHH